MYKQMMFEQHFALINNFINFIFQFLKKFIA